MDEDRDFLFIPPLFRHANGGAKEKKKKKLKHFSMCTV
jgi:hypothetical protein